jgi:hypothetical protein
MDRMRWRGACVSCLLAVSAVPALAQEQAATSLERRTIEWAFVGAAGSAVSINGSKADRYFLMQSASWGRVLTRSRGPRPLAGRLELAVEVVPAFLMVQPQRTFGFGVTPLVVRWNLEPRGRLQVFADLAGGLLRSAEPIPEETARVNFTAQAGAGLRIAASARHAVLVGYRLHHLSNGGRAALNPAVNSHVIFGGLALMR